MSNAVKNPGISLALPITLGLILLLLIFVVVIFVVKSRKQLVQKWKLMKLPKARSVTNTSEPSNSRPNGHQQIRLFPTTNGLQQVENIYYDEDSIYQAGKCSRDAFNFVSDWIGNRGVNNVHGRIGEETDNETTRVDILKRHSVTQNVYDDLEHSRNKKMDENIEKRRHIISVQEIKQSEIQDDLDGWTTTEKRKTFVAMYPMSSSSQDELNLTANDVIYYLGEKRNGWLRGRKKESGEVGWFPRSYVREGVSQAPDTSMFVSESTENNEFDEDDDDNDDDGLFECVVKHDYEATYDGDLSLKKGDRVMVREILENGWWRGEVHGVNGFFPGSYVQISESLVTKSCTDVSDELSRKVISSNCTGNCTGNCSGNCGKRSSLGRQFIQKFSILNFGTLKKGKPNRKMRKESIKVLSRMPAPFPNLELNSMSLDEKEKQKKLNKPIEMIVDMEKNIIHSCPEETQSIENANNLDSESVYGNYQDFAAETTSSVSSLTQKPYLPTKQKAVEPSHPSSSSSSLVEDHKIFMDHRPVASMSAGVRATSSSSLLDSSRHSINFDDELKNRVNMRMKIRDEI